MIGRRSFKRSAGQVRILGIFMFFAAIFAATFAPAQVLFGTQTVEPSVDSNAVGQAEAFQTTATSSGTVGSLSFYVASTNKATTIYVGLYADNAGHPGTLLAQGSSSTLTKSAWNTVAVPSANVNSGTHYWIAILGTTGGKPYFRDHESGATCTSETSKQTTLTQLPATWTSGGSFEDCPLSAYGTAAAVTTNPVLSVSALSISFSAAPSGTEPAPVPVNVTNTGTGTLSYTTNSDSAWLTVTPPSGSAPSTLQVSASPAGLAIGSYTGHVTVTATGAQNSPDVITVYLTVVPATDWSMVDHDTNRSGNAAEETTINNTNVGNLSWSWSASVDGPVTGQPLFVSGITISAQTQDVVVVGTGGNSVYALNAATGSVLWHRNFGTPASNCSIPGGFGVTGTPLVDRTTDRIYAVSDDGMFRTISLLDGTDAAPAITLVANPGTNKVWGGLNKIGNYVYVATGSDGCETQPWQGQVYRVNVSTNPVLVNSFVVVPGIAGSDPGGGISGYGGVSSDPATGNIYAATVDDVNEAYTPYADRAIELDDTLSLLGSYDPPESCGNTPCALDFAATPLVFQPAGCSTMALVGNMNGNLYLFRATDLASGAAPLQVLTLNAANSNLGAGGLGGTPAYWAAGNMVYVTDAGPGVNGISAGVVGLTVTPSCTLQVAWSTALESASQQVSTPTVANGVVFAGEGQTGELHAFDALTGNLLWSSNSQYAAAATYAAPTVASGHVYAGSWSNFTGGGIVGAFSLNTSAQILSVSTQTVNFNAVQGGSNPASTTVGVSNTGTGTLTFSAASDSAWLSVAPTGGSAPQNLQIAANIAGLSANTYTGHITVTAAGAQQSPQTITVTLVVSPPPPILTVSTNALNFSGTQGGTNPSNQPVNVSNTGGGTLTFTASSDSAWLTPNSSGGTAPQTLQVGVNLAGLTANTYTGHITVAATGVQGSPQTITVTLVVNAPAPVLSVSTNALNFSGTQGGSNPSTQPVNVSNTGGGTLTFTATSDSAWLTPNSSGGTAPQTLQVGVNLSGLTANTYTGHITVGATGVQGSPQTITVTLVVNAPAPVLSVSTNALSFSGTVGGANPATQPVNVSNTGGGTLTFTSSSDSAWLTVNSSGGTAPQTLQVGVNLSGLAANTYTGHITVAASGVQGSPQTVTVTLKVSSSSGTILLGDQTIESSTDSNANGQAEAFQATSNASGTLTSLMLYVDSTSTSTKVYVGIYADNNGNPGTLLTQGSATPTKGAWNTISVPTANITSATPYWIAVLGTTSGKIVFRDHSSGSCKSQTSSVSTLTSLPATWTSGTNYSDCPISAYGGNSAPPVATKVAVSSGNNQTGNPGTQLAQALTALVTDQYGNPFSGSSVTFTDNGAGGTFGSPNPVATGANGIASQTYTLPSSNTTVTIDASATGITSPAVFTENSAVPVATKIAVSSGNNQTAAPGTKLPQSLTVLVTDQFGNPLSGNSVTFTDNGAGGTFASPNPVVTGANGVASQTYTLPASNATVTIDATAAGLASPAVFTENSVTSVATTMVITGGNNQFGTPGSQLSQSLTVAITDQYGNPLSGESVTFSDNGAGGTFGNSNPVVTGANGVATQTYTLPGSARTVTIDATAAGISNPAVFTETAGAGLAPIARDGSCSAAGTSCTFNATSPGDLKIVFAYHSASTTAPTLPSGWTNIATFATATGGTTAAVTIGCEVSSSSGDTNSGTWTNASDVVGVSYSGTNVGTTANCNQTGIGQLATNSAKTSANADFPALNPMMYSSGSWVAGFLANSAGGLCTPSGMSAVATVGSAILANDTGAPVTSWSDQSCSTTSGTWVSYVLEVVPQQGFTLIQTAENASCTSGTTCAITLQQPTTAGNLNYYSCYSKEHPVMVSVNKGGTLITPTSCTSHINSTVYSCGYIDPANTSAATSPITVTMSAAESGFGACRFWEYRPNTTGTVDLDAAFVADQPSGTAPVGPALTTSGGAPVVIQNAVSGNKITAETFPYSRQQTIDTAGASWSSAVNPASSTPPTWTVSPGISSTQGAAFSFNPTPCSSVGVIDWSGGTNGNTLALSDVAASTHGLSTGHASGTDAWILSASPATGMTYTTAAFKALTTPRRLCGGGTTTSGTGNLGMKYDLSTPVSKYIEYQFFTPFQAISMGFWMQTSLGNVDEQYDFANLATWPNFGAATGVHHINGNIEMECYGGTTNKTVIAAIQPNTWYWVTFQLNTSGASAAVYNANGTQAGIGSCVPDGWTFSGLGDMGLGRTGSDGDNPAGMYYYFGTVVFDTEGHFPILP